MEFDENIQSTHYMTLLFNSIPQRIDIVVSPIYRTRATITRSWTLTVQKVRILQKKILKKTFLSFKNGVKIYKPRVIMARVRYSTPKRHMTLDNLFWNY